MCSRDLACFNHMSRDWPPVSERRNDSPTQLTQICQRAFAYDTKSSPVDRLEFLEPSASEIQRHEQAIQTTSSFFHQATVPTLLPERNMMWKG